MFDYNIKCSVCALPFAKSSLDNLDFKTKYLCNIFRLCPKCQDDSDKFKIAVELNEKIKKEKNCYFI
jgi:uncharacterized protein YlaI